MALIEFKDLPDTSTPLTADNLNNNFNECYNIVESGENANGRYIKYSDGTMICYKKIDCTGLSLPNEWGAGWYYTIVQGGDFPQAFIETPTINCWFGNTSVGCIVMNYGAASSSTTGNFLLLKVGSHGTLTSGYVYVTAIGKWK